MTVAEQRQELRPLALAGLILALLAGLVVAFGSPLVLVLFLALLAGMVLIAYPTALLWLVLIGGLVFSGLAELYLPQLRHLRWGVVIAAVALGLAGILSLFFQKKVRAGSFSSIPFNPLIWLGIFFVIALFSAFLNRGFSFDAVIGLKGYFQVYGIVLALAWVAMRPATVDRYVKFLLWLALLQIPFALHQYLVLVPQRLSQSAAYNLIVAPDIVVGTFVGSLGGGGGSAILAVLQVTAMGMALAFCRAGKMSVSVTAGLSFAYLVPLALNETRITFVLLFVMLGVVFHDQVFRHPVKMFIAAIAASLLVFAFAVIYTYLPRAPWQQNADIRDHYEKTMEYNFGEKGYGGMVLNRTTVYPFWMQHHGLKNLGETLIGHGPGATNEGDAGLMRHSLARDSYRRIGIGLTGISALLWETGVLGLSAILAAFASVLFQAHSITRKIPGNTVQWALLKGVEAGIAMLAVSLLHNNYVVFEIGFQSMLMLMLGYVLHVRRRLTD